MTIENLYMPGKIRTFTGKYVDPFDMHPDDICIEDIAHALSLIPRFGGHTRIPISVASHSLAVAAMVPDRHKLAALLHDASEAYLLDLPKPLKERPEMYPYLEAEERLMYTIARKFGFDYPLHRKVKDADRYQLEQEWQVYMLDGETFGSWIAASVEGLFLESFKKYSAQANANI